MVSVGGSTRVPVVVESDKQLGTCVGDREAGNPVLYGSVSSTAYPLKERWQPSFFSGSTHCVLSARKSTGCFTGITGSAFGAAA
ncbi:MAG: hypothetical protein ACXV3E_05480 [Halobacteriota archaeon]